MVDKLKAGASFADVAAADELEGRRRPGLKRGSPPPGSSAATRRGDVPHREGRRPAAPRATADRTGRVPGDRHHGAGLRAAAAETKRIDDALRRAIAEDLIAQYVARLQTDLGATINQEALRQVAGGSSQN